MTSRPIRNSRPVRLHDRDRADFEQVLTRALSTGPLRDAFPGAPGEADGPLGPDAALLRAEVRDATERIMASSGKEYSVYVRMRATADKRAARRTRPSGVKGRGLLPALAVLAPAISGVAAVIFLLLGTVLDVAGAQEKLAHSLVLTGWACAAIAVIALLAGALGLVAGALRNRRSAIRGYARTGESELERARQAWHRALLERGMVPFLTDLLRDRPAPPAPSTGTEVEPATDQPADRSTDRPGEQPTEHASPRRYSSPDFSGPDYSGPGF